MGQAQWEPGGRLEEGTKDTGPWGTWGSGFPRGVVPGSLLTGSVAPGVPTRAWLPSEGQQGGVRGRWARCPQALRLSPWSTFRQTRGIWSLSSGGCHSPGQALVQPLLPGATRLPATAWRRAGTCVSACGVKAPREEPPAVPGVTRAAGRQGVTEGHMHSAGLVSPWGGPVGWPWQTVPPDLLYRREAGGWGRH